MEHGPGAVRPLLTCDVHHAVAHLCNAMKYDEATLRYLQTAAASRLLPPLVEDLKELGIFRPLDASLVCTSPKCDSPANSSIASSCSSHSSSSSSQSNTANHILGAWRAGPPASLQKASPKTADSATKLNGSSTVQYSAKQEEPGGIKQLREVLGSEVPRHRLAQLLKDANDDVATAIDLYFADLGADHNTTSYLPETASNKEARSSPKDLIASSPTVSQAAKDDGWTTVECKGFPRATTGLDVLYSAVVLDDASHHALVQRFESLIPFHWRIIADHMTICMGPIIRAFQDVLQIRQTVCLHVTHVGISWQAVAARVEGCPSINPVPHVTIAVAPGCRPHESNNIDDWQPLGERMEPLVGRVFQVNVITRRSEGYYRSLFTPDKPSASFSPKRTKPLPAAHNISSSSNVGQYAAAVTKAQFMATVSADEMYQQDEGDDWRTADDSFARSNPQVMSNEPQPGKFPDIADLSPQLNQAAEQLRTAQYFQLENETGIGKFSSITTEDRRANGYQPKYQYDEQTLRALRYRAADPPSSIFQVKDVCLETDNQKSSPPWHRRKWVDHRTAEADGRRQHAWPAQTRPGKPHAKNAIGIKGGEHQGGDGPADVDIEARRPSHSDSAERLLRIAGFIVTEDMDDSEKAKGLENDVCHATSVGHVPLLPLHAVDSGATNDADRKFVDPFAVRDRPKITYDEGTLRSLRHKGMYPFESVVANQEVFSIPNWIPQGQVADSSRHPNKLHGDGMHREQRPSAGERHAGSGSAEQNAGKEDAAPMAGGVDLAKWLANAMWKHCQKTATDIGIEGGASGITPEDDDGAQSSEGTDSLKRPGMPPDSPITPNEGHDPSDRKMPANDHMGQSQDITATASEAATVSDAVITHTDHIIEELPHSSLSSGQSPTAAEAEPATEEQIKAGEEVAEGPGPFTWSHQSKEAAPPSELYSKVKKESLGIPTGLAGATAATEGRGTGRGRGRGALRVTWAGL